MSILKNWNKREIKDWIKDLDESQKTLYGIIMNSVMFSAIELIIGLFFVKKYSNFLLGIILGTIVAIMMVRNMYSVIGRALAENAQTAEETVRKGSILRMICLFVVFVIAIYAHKYINILAMVISIFNLKFAAYIQPFTNKYLFEKISEKGR